MTKRVPGLLSALAIAMLIAAFPAVAADPNKVLHVAFVAPENGFDPQATGDLYSNYVNRQIFDSLYRYDYLARPYKVIPNTAAGLPEISSDGLTWTIKVRPGIYFTDDAAFKGKKRELAAADYVYSWKRLLDPKLRSINAQIFDDRLVGAKAAIEAAKKTGKLLRSRSRGGHSDFARHAGEWCKCDRRALVQRERRYHSLRIDNPFAYTATFIHNNTGNAPTMTRTPTTSVTAIAFAARAFAWNDFLDARLSGQGPGMLLPLSR